MGVGLRTVFEFDIFVKLIILSKNSLDDEKNEKEIITNSNRNSNLFI